MGTRKHLQKKFNKFKLSFDWFSCPINLGGTEAYFKEYKNIDLNGYEKNNLVTGSYVLKPAVLNNGLWVDSKRAEERSPLFRNQLIDEVSIEDEYSDKVVLDIDLKGMGQMPSKLEKPLVYSRGSTNGFVKFSLVCPEFAFGHKHYSKLLSLKRY